MPGLTDETPARPILPGHQPKPVQQPPFPGVDGPGVWYAGTSNVWVDSRWRWVALNRESSPDWLTRTRDRAHQQEMRCGVWDPRVEYDSAALVAGNFDFYIGQIEGPGQYDRCLENIAGLRIAHPELPAAIVTNMGGLETAALAAPFVDAGYHLIVEVSQASGHTIAGQIDYAIRVLEWPAHRVAPLIELDQGATLADYPGWDTWRGVSVFTAEALQ